MTTWRRGSNNQLTVMTVLETIVMLATLPVQQTMMTATATTIYFLSKKNNQLAATIVESVAALAPVQ